MQFNMMRESSCFAAIVLFLCIIIGEVQGHAVLSKPDPWFWAASRDRPCGGGVYNPEASAIWEMGSIQTLQWWVIALDGTGNVSARIDTAGGSTFNPASPTVKNVTVVQPDGGIHSQGYFYVNLTVPTVNCTGPSKLCTMQFWTNNGCFHFRFFPLLSFVFGFQQISAKKLNRYTCMTVNITCKGCAPVDPPPMPKQCVKAPNISFCSYKSQTQVTISKGANATAIDKLVEEQYNLNINHPLVFANANNSLCQNNYKVLLCEYYLPACGNYSSSFSRQACDQILNDYCDMEVNIYNCSNFRDISEISQPFVPSVNASVYVPSLNASVYVPSSNSSIYVPSSNSSINVPSSNSSINVPSSNSSTYVPSSNSSINVPSSNSSTYVPSSNSSTYVPPGTYVPPSFPSTPKSTPTPTPKPSSSPTPTPKPSSSPSPTFKPSSSPSPTVKPSSSPTLSPKRSPKRYPLPSSS